MVEMYTPDMYHSFYTLPTTEWNRVATNVARVGEVVLIMVHNSVADPGFGKAPVERGVSCACAQ